jgi:hypothetical protein
MAGPSISAATGRRTRIQSMKMTGAGRSFSPTDP